MSRFAIDPMVKSVAQGFNIKKIKPPKNKLIN